MRNISPFEVEDHPTMAVNHAPRTYIWSEDDTVMYDLQETRYRIHELWMQNQYNQVAYGDNMATLTKMRYDRGVDWNQGMMLPAGGQAAARTWFLFHGVRATFEPIDLTEDDEEEDLFGPIGDEVFETVGDMMDMALVVDMAVEAEDLFTEGYGEDASVAEPVIHDDMADFAVADPADPNFLA